MCRPPLPTTNINGNNAVTLRLHTALYFSVKIYKFLTIRKISRNAGKPAISGSEFGNRLDLLSPDVPLLSHSTVSHFVSSSASAILMTLCRLVTSIYEAANIHSILHCRENKKDKTPLWFMYVTATVQFLMVEIKLIQVET